MSEFHKALLVLATFIVVWYIPVALLDEATYMNIYKFMVAGAILCFFQPWKYFKL